MAPCAADLVRDLRNRHSKWWVDEDRLEVSREVLGKGATGQVVKGKYMGQSVAVKKFNISKVPAGSNVLSMLQKELAVMLAISGECKRTCQYKGFTVKGDEFCLVMRKYDGSLADLIAKEYAAGGISVNKVVRYARQILEALKELHGKKVIVVDLKPDNLLYASAADELVATDFGLSRIVTETFGAFTTSAMAGTPSYMSPEQYESDDGITSATDMWSWALTVVHMATGKVPFGNLRNFMQIATKVKAGKASLEVPSYFPDHLKGLLKGCLSIDPAKRPSSTEAVKVLHDQAYGISDNSSSSSSSSTSTATNQPSRAPAPVRPQVAPAASNNSGQSSVATPDRSCETYMTRSTSQSSQRSSAFGAAYAAPVAAAAAYRAPVPQPRIMYQSPEPSFMPIYEHSVMSYSSGYGGYYDSGSSRPHLLVRGLGEVDVRTGPRGGQYYINASGNKSYLRGSQRDRLY